MPLLSFYCPTPSGGMAPTSLERCRTCRGFARSSVRSSARDTQVQQAPCPAAVGSGHVLLLRFHLGSSRVVNPADGSRASIGPRRPEFLTVRSYIQRGKRRMSGAVLRPSSRCFTRRPPRAAGGAAKNPRCNRERARPPPPGLKDPGTRRPIQEFLGALLASPLLTAAAVHGTAQLAVRMASSQALLNSNTAATSLALQPPLLSLSGHSELTANLLCSQICYFIGTCQIIMQFHNFIA
ncbi:hypothetical protein SEVIR_4G024401v4 [Setaria viridis]